MKIVYGKEFEKLYDVIIEKDGKITNKDVEKCGIGFEYFLRLSQFDSKTLVDRAKSTMEIYKKIKEKNNVEV